MAVQIVLNLVVYLVFVAIGYLISKRIKPPKDTQGWLVWVIVVLLAGGICVSGHAFNIMLICGFITYLLWPVWRRAWAHSLILTVSLFLILLVGFSRIYLRVHWLDDVLAGYAVGLAWLLISKGLTTAIFPARGPARPGP